MASPGISLVAALAAGLLLSASLSCSRASPASRAQTSSGALASPAQTPAPQGPSPLLAAPQTPAGASARAPAPGPQEAPKTGSPSLPPQPAKPKPRPVLAASLRAFGLSANAAIMPEDFSIGALQDYRSGSDRLSSALATAQGLMDGLAKGKLDPALLVPEEREALSLALAPLSGEMQGGDFRYGQISLSGDEAWMRVRLAPAGDGPSHEGLLSLRADGEVWRVESLSFAVAAKARGSTFEPGMPPALGPGD
ncbi:MAG TPA: hypothetical protein VFL04_08495 [Rectinemataceae bacterium]|nr:hypothetical protein [Rectinemataceae bacterium]